MALTDEDLRKRLTLERFPRSSAYDPRWVLENEMGPSALWLTEWLCEVMELQPGMRVLDMGCGKGLSSVFLAKEAGVQVWATDLWIKASDNWERIRQAGVEEHVFPIHSDARQLPYADEFFDAIVSVDSYHYYGTDDLYLRYFTRFLKRDGRVGIVVPGLMREFEGGIPAHLSKRQPSGARFWDPAECFSIHTVDWWRNHWSQTDLVEVEVADTLADGYDHWLLFEKVKVALNINRSDDEVEALEVDQGQYLGFVRLVARRHT